MFGLLVAGRLLQTNLVQIDETEGVFSIPNPESINHLCVFLLGTVPFPDGFGATVHFHQPGKGFQLLGMISNEKPSAIFRVRNVFTAQNTSGIMAMTPKDASEEAVVGLSIAPLDTVLAQVAPVPASSAPDSSMVQTRASAQSVMDPTFLAQKIVQNLFNFLSSFEAVGNGVFVQLADLERWYEKFVQKIKNQGLQFLERAE